MKDAKGKDIKAGDRVQSYDPLKMELVSGTLMKNDEHLEVSEFYVKYDDGEECAVLDPEMLLKIEGE